MRLFLLWECYYDNCDVFESLVDVYQDEAEASKECDRLSAKVYKNRRDYEYFQVNTRDLK